MTRKPAPRVLVLDSEPTRRLSRRWFGGWLGKRLGCQLSVPHVIGGTRVKSLDGFDVLIISGSPESARQEDDWVHHELDLIEEADKRGLPMLGVCFGAQLLGRAYWGKEVILVRDTPEIGWHPIECLTDDALLKDVPRRFVTFQWHEEEVIAQEGMTVLAKNDSTYVQAFRVGEKPIWGVQFHPEITPRAGRDLLRRERSAYEGDGLRYEELAAQAQPNLAAEQLFRNFIASGME